MPGGGLRPPCPGMPGSGHGTPDETPANDLLTNWLLTYLRRPQERGLMQKARRLMDENSVSFQMILILLYSITLGSESQTSVFKQCLSNT